jgi:hypothetical protein
MNRLVLLVIVAILAVPCGSCLAANPADRTLCDINVLYLFDDAESIDWPTLYYLNDAQACRIDLVTVTEGSVDLHEITEIADQDIFLHRCQIAADNNATASVVMPWLIAERRPDVVILGSAQLSARVNDLAEALGNLPQAPKSLFNIQRIYRHAVIDTQTAAAVPAVTVNGREFFERYRDRMQLEIPRLFPWFDLQLLASVRLSRYEIVQSTDQSRRPRPDFLSGLNKLRLIPAFDTVFQDGALKNSFVNRARNFISFFDLSNNTVGAQRAENLITGYKELIVLEDQVKGESILRTIPEFAPYLASLAARAQRAVLAEIGMDWRGDIILRDSPHGPKLKFVAALSVNGPKTIELSYVRFLPYWDSSSVVLDETSRKISPHQSFVREYLVDIDRRYLEAQMPESLVFEAEIVYGNMPMKVTSAVPIWESPNLSVTFVPDFFFIPPAARLDIDRVVSAMNWKAVIAKPMFYHGTVTLNLQTPRGVFAGAYRQTWELEKGRQTETVRIPFSVSNLFELGIHQQTISLIVDGRQVAADTGRMRIAACEVSDTITIGLMPDTTGLLEDILRMAGAKYWPLTDRALQTGDLDAYNVILVGPGALRDYPSFKQIKGRLEDFIRFGGSLVVLGQPANWPEGALPVSFVATEETVAGAQILNRIPQARLLTTPYAISEAGLMAYLEQARRLTPAVIAPAEKVYVTPSGATLLSVSKLGEGQVIFCGWPLIEMISDLNIEAIHLLANLLNY